MKKDALLLNTDFGRIRCARPRDAACIVQMVEALARHHGDTPAITADHLIRDAFGQDPWYYLLVAEAGERLVGYVALCGVTRLHFGLRGLEMHHLFTEGSFRGCGVGRSLIEASIIRAMTLSCSYLTVGTHSDNVKAQAFYEAMGFERQDAHPPRFSMTLGSRSPLTRGEP